MCLQSYWVWHGVFAAKYQMGLRYHKPVSILNAMIAFGVIGCPWLWVIAIGCLAGRGGKAPGGSSVLRQYEELKDAFNAERGSTRRGHINLTGGEPFMREDMPEILRYMASRRHSYTCGVLSNGAMLTREYITLLKETGVSHVQLSIEGRHEVHDALRAPGDYDRTMRKAAELDRSGIKVHISFTANRENHHDLPEVAAACRKRGLTRLWSDRIVPIGGGADMAALTIGRDELPEYLASLYKAKGGRLTQLLHPRTEVRMNRALQCLGGGMPYRCGAGNTLIVVDELGRIMP